MISPLKKAHLKLIGYVGLAFLLCWSIVTWQPAIATVQSQPSAMQAVDATASLLTQGRNAFATGRFSEAADLWQQAAQTYGKQGNQRDQAISLSYVGLAYQELGQWEAAKQAISQGFQLLKGRTTQADQLALAQSWNTQGKLLLAQGDPQAALDAWKMAEQLYSQSKDFTGTIGSQVNQAQALQLMGLYRQAQTRLEQVYQQLKGQPASSLTIATLANLGSVWQMTGNLDAAQTVLQQALTQAQNLNQSSETSSVLFSLGNLARVNGKKEPALLFYQQAAKDAPDLLRQLEARANQFSLLLEENRWADARELWRQVEPTLAALTLGRRGVYVQVNLAASLVRHYNAWPAADRPALTEVASHLARAIQQARVLNDTRAESFATGQLASLYEKTQQWKSAESLTQQALLEARQINAADIAYRWQWQLGRIYQQLADRDQAIQNYSQAVSLLQSLRTDLAAMRPDVQFSFREEVEPVYRELVSLLTQPDQPSQQDLQQARQVIESLQLAELENFLRAPCLNAQPKLVDTLDQKAAVLYPVILPDRLNVILSLPGQPLQLYRAPVTQQKLETTVQQFLSTLNPVADDQERLQLARKIYSWLIQPIEDNLKQRDSSTLVFVLDGILRNVPVAALYDGKQYLVEKYNLAIAPGLQLLDPRSLTEEQRLQVLIGGLTQSRQGFSALPGVARESELIASSLKSQVVLDQNFTQAGLEKQIQKSSFPLVHLATHGKFSSQLSDTFLLTWDSKMTVQDLRQLLQAHAGPGDRPIELLVLSACETASGDQRSALGLAGLSVRSGARSTLATLWSVNDDSTAKLMIEFYQVLIKQRLNKAAALRQAQLKILNSSDYNHPYYWSAFILVGNWL